MRTLITGGAGFIGTHLRRHLEVLGHTVDVLDLKAETTETRPERGEYIHGDCRNETTVKYIARRADFVFHLAATVGVRRVLEDPAGCIENNIESLRTVLKYSKTGIFASTSEVYGKTLCPSSYPAGRIYTAGADGYKETDLASFSGATRWVYAESKLLGEHLAQAKGWKSVRFFNIVGPGQNTAYGAVLPNFVKQAITGQPITVYGDGKQVRSFLDVRDCVQILARLIPVEFGVVNVGGDGSTSIDGLASIVRYATGSASQIVNLPYREAYPAGFEECPYRVPDLSRMRRLVGECRFYALDDTILDLAASLRPQLQAEVITQ